LFVHAASSKSLKNTEGKSCNFLFALAALSADPRVVSPLRNHEVVPFADNASSRDSTLRHWTGGISHNKYHQLKIDLRWRDAVTASCPPLRLAPQSSSANTVREVG
jgi:hypothetical protein